jgi:heterodisulfide reductase subunit C
MAQELLQPDYQFLDEVETFGPFDTSACFQCRKCTNGCPVTFAMDLYPDEVIRWVVLGQKEKVLNCRTIWICAACETCTTRCPNGVKIAELMDCLKEMAIREGVPSPQPQVSTFHQSFLNNVKQRGRVFEASLLLLYMFRSGEIWKKWGRGTLIGETILGLKLFYKGRMPVFPKGIKGKEEVRKLLNPPKKTEEAL